MPSSKRLLTDISTTIDRRKDYKGLVHKKTYLCGIESEVSVSGSYYVEMDEFANRL